MASGLKSNYIPFLKGKAGEFGALSKLDVDERDPLTPLIEVPPPKITYHERGASIETADKALRGYADRLAKAWGNIDYCYVDLAAFEPHDRLVDGTHPVTAFFKDAKAADLAAIPVTGLDRDTAQREAVQAVCEAWRAGLAVRLRRDALRDLGALREQLPKLLDEVGQEPENVDLFLDFGELLASNAGEVEEKARAAISSVPDLDAWRSLTLCTGAFPAELSRFIKPTEAGTRPRRDWNLWRGLASGAKPLPRIPGFADYGATSAGWGPPFNPKTMNPAAKIVYTSEDHWVIVRGRSFRDHGGDQYQRLASQMVARDEFLGAEHCSTDKKITDCAAGSGKKGNLTQWVSAATRHHLEVVTRQLAILGES